MSTKPGLIDAVRASREGHSYHERWAARVALELLLPTTDLVAISIEGFSPEDASGLSKEAVEIADLVKYRGSHKREDASRIEVVQLKYSVARADVPIHFSDIAQTIRKFALVEQDQLAQLGRSRVEEVVRYEIVTNRAFHPDLLEEVRGIVSGQIPPNLAKLAAHALQIAPDVTGLDLASFFGRLSLTGSAGSNPEVRALLGKTIADWSSGSDTLAKMRLHSLESLVRDKAGAPGKLDNLISRVDLLGVLDIAHEDQLYPTQDAFPSIRQIVERSITNDLLEEVERSDQPILIHASGGVGKTVLMQTLATRLQAGAARVVLFDCFGAGRWRDPADQRHSPRRALVHIANLLAGQGLCDLLIPGDNEADLTRSFRDRLVQAIRTLKTVEPRARLILLLDAIDHAGMQAQGTRDTSFAHLLLKTLLYQPIEGVTLIVSCRTERRKIATDGILCREYRLRPLSQPETESLIRLGDPSATKHEVAELFGRSGGNPRVLDALIRRGRPYHIVGMRGGSNAHPIALEELLQSELDVAAQRASTSGVNDAEIESFLSGLALLPPPVPLEELSAAEGQEKAAIESFVVDLFPLIEHTQHGLIFRDEPTETLIRRRYPKDAKARRTLVERIQERQAASVYAARALPHVLTLLGLREQLIELAFSEQMPASASSSVAVVAIRIARLSAAIHISATEDRRDDLVRLLIEAGRVAVGHGRSDRFLQDYPDLLAISRDPEALRRLFESTARWPGSKHAALAIAYAFAGDLNQSRRDAARAFDWFNWHVRNPEESRVHFHEHDICGPAFVEVLASNSSRVALWLSNWSPESAYRHFCHILSLIQRHDMIHPDASSPTERLADRVTRCRLQSQPLAAAIMRESPSFGDREATLLGSLASIFSIPNRGVDDPIAHQDGDCIADALSVAAIRLMKLRLVREARSIIDSMPPHRPDLWRYNRSWYGYKPVERWLLLTAVTCANQRRWPSIIDLAPSEINSQIRSLKDRKTVEAFERAVARLLAAPPRRRQRRGGRSGQVRSLNVREAANTLRYRVRPLLPLTRAISGLILDEGSEGAVCEALAELSEVVRHAGNYPYHDGKRFAAEVGLNSLLVAFDATGSLTGNTAAKLVEWLLASPIRSPAIWLRTVTCLARRSATHASAIALARATYELIQRETDADERISMIGALSRAVWHSSREEAATYFRRGLDSAEALGSGDHETVEALLEIASHYRGPLLPESEAYTLSRICELQIFDIDRFPWLDFGKGMGKVAGPMALAVLTRLCRRRKTELGWALSPLLSSLIEANHLEVDLAAGLIGLDAPIETWHWSLADFADRLLPDLNGHARVLFVEFLLQEIDRSYGASYPLESLRLLDRTVLTRLGADAPQSKWITVLINYAERNLSQDNDDVQALSTSPQSPFRAERAAAKHELASIDLGNPDAIDQVLSESSKDAERQRVSWIAIQLLSQMRQLVHGVDEMLRYIGAIAALRVPNLDTKLSILTEAIATQNGKSLALEQMRPRLALELAERHTSELLASGFEGWSILRRLTDFSGGHGPEIVTAILRNARAQASDVRSDTWLRFAAALAQESSAESVRSALLRYLHHAAQALPDEVGDGRWTPERSVPKSTTALVAGLLWAQLGDPEAQKRWRAAHAIRRLVQLHQGQILHLLFDHFSRITAGALQDQRFGFQFLHARLWLLIAVARIARDEPKCVLPFRCQLEAVAFNENDRHVFMKEFAKMALINLAGCLEQKQRLLLLRRLRGVNSSPMEPIDWRVRGYRDSSESRENSDQEGFYFDYDFEKYQVDSLTHIFDCNRAEVLDRCRAWLRRWSPHITRPWQESDSDISEANDSDERNGANRDTWGQHLSWHSLLAAVGELLSCRPVLKWNDDEDRWEEWLQSHTLARNDGLWLSDGTDRFPPDMRLSVSDTKGNPPKGTDLAALAGIQAGLKLGDELVIGGNWKTPDKLEVGIVAVLVDPEWAMSLAIAIAIDEPFHQSIPTEEDFAWRFPGLQSTWVRPMTVSDRAPESALDRSDPYGSHWAYERPQPAKGILAALGVSPADPFGRQWCDQNGSPILRSEAWGTNVGRERGVTETGGSRLLFGVQPMQNLLRDENCKLVLLIKCQRYLGDSERENRLQRRRKPTDHFVTTSLIVLISGEGVARPLRRVPKAARSAVGTLPEDSRHNLFARMKSIHKLLQGPEVALRRKRA